MTTRFPHLFQGGTIGSLQLKNRMVMAPMGMRYMDSHGNVTNHMIDYYVERARGGVGLIVTEAAYPRFTGHPGRLRIDTDDAIAGLVNLSKAVHTAGAKIVMQLNPSRGRVDEVEAVSPSETVFLGIKPRALLVPEIEKIVQYFAAGVARAKRAGFDGIMIHGGSGYLIGEFLSPLTNKRTDSYGGSLEGRARLAMELTREAKESGGRDFVVIFRMGCDEHVPGGFAGEEAALVAPMLEKAGADAIDVVSGSIPQDTLEWAVTPAAIPLAFNTGLSVAIKKKVRVPVMVAGRITTPQLAEEVLVQGKADFIDLGRELITDPYFAQKAAEYRIEDIVPCIGCVNCDEDIRLRRTAVTCTVNPAVGKESKFQLKLGTKSKLVLVIGGGPAGMEAARVAALRGHRVILWEKEPRLGGQLNQAAIPPYKVELNILKNYLVTQLRKAGVRVELEKEATTEAVERLGPDVVVVATGSRPQIPEIPGIERSGAVDAREALERGVKGDAVVVIGGELVGCETAEFLADQGKKVTVSRRGKEMATDVPHLARKLLLRRLEAKGVRLLPGIQYEKITERGVSVIHPDGKREFLEADTIVLATGSVSEDNRFSALKDRVAEVYRIGDCSEPRKLKDALYEGALVALRI